MTYGTGRVLDSEYLKIKSVFFKLQMENVSIFYSLGYSCSKLVFLESAYSTDFISLKD